MALGRFSRWAILPLIAVVASAAGCAPNTGDLSGKVTFNGKPVTSGAVQAFLPDGSTRAAEIAPDGGYKLVGLAPGKVKLGVSSPHPKQRFEELSRFARTPEQKQALLPPAPELVTSWVALPDGLAQPNASGLVATVKPGGTQHDLVLTGTPPATDPAPKLTAGAGK